MVSLHVQFRKVSSGKSSETLEKGALKHTTKTRETNKRFSPSLSLAHTETPQHTHTLNSPGVSAAKETRITSISPPGGICHADRYSVLPSTNSPGGFSEKFPTKSKGWENAWMQACLCLRERLYGSIGFEGCLRSFTCAARYLVRHNTRSRRPCTRDTR